MSRFETETDPKTGEVTTYYAIVKWEVSDVEGRVPGWSTAEAEAWLRDNAKYIEEALSSHGNETIDIMLHSERKAAIDRLAGELSSLAEGLIDADVVRQMLEDGDDPDDVLAAIEEEREQAANG